MEHVAAEALLSDLKKHFEELPIEVKKQLIAIFHDLRNRVEHTERKSVLGSDRSKQSWFASA